MVKRIVTFALHQPLFLLLLVALFIASGLVAFKTLPIEAFPDVTDVQVSVITLFPGHAPEEVEKQVTIPIEIALSGVPHAVRLFSHTQFGLSFVILTFNDQASDYFARQQVLERLQGVELPPGVQPGLAPLSTPIGEIYRYRLKGDNTSPTDLRSLQDWVVARHLKMTPGVADVVSFGGFIKQYQVSLRPDKMYAFHLTLQQVFTALGRGNANAGGSYLERGEQQFLIRGIGLLRSGDDIGNIVLSERDGTPVLIKHIADVQVSVVPRQGIVGQDNDDEVVSGIVLMRKGENPSEVLTALSVFLIFVLLFHAFNSVKSALLILVNVPFALIGGIVALLFTGIHLSVSAAIGFIALFGQAVLNGVVMVSYFNQLCDTGLRPFQPIFPPNPKH